MNVYVVTEVDERADAQSSGPLSVHVDKARAVEAAREFNTPRRGVAREIGHYAHVFTLPLDMTGIDHRHHSANPAACRP